MPQPIPSNSIRPLTVGERVQFVPEWQDPGDKKFERVVIEIFTNDSEVRIRTTIPGMTIHPAEIIEATKLTRVIDLGAYSDLPPETVIEKHAAELPKETRLWLVEKFPAEMMEAGKPTPEEVDLCAQLHPGIALSRAVDSIPGERILELAETHSFQVLLYASHRLDAKRLRKLAAERPGECIIILERHPESRLRFSLRALHDDLNPNVAKALNTVSSPGG